MNSKRFLKQSSLLIGVLVTGLLFSGQAFAVQDRLYTTNVNSVNVGGSSADYTTNLAGAGGNRTVNITDDIVGAQPVTVTVTWGIQIDTQPPHTSYPKNGVGFDAVTSQGTSVTGLSVSPSSCDFSTNTATCNTTISFTTPNVTDDPIEVTINPNNTGSAPTQLLTGHLKILFTTIAVQEKLETSLTMPDPQCFVYGAGSVDLEATLTETASTDPVSGRTVYFDLDESPIGSAVTGADGKAVLAYDISGLAGGDHDLYAEFLGDADYHSSNAAATLGVSYTFVGFQQPINPEGNSVFGNGRVIPIKVRIVGADLLAVPDATPTVHLYRYSESTVLGEEMEQPTSVSAADTDNIMRFVPEDGHYIYNWDLSSLANGTYVVVVNLGDSTACSKGPYMAFITVEKRGGRK